MTFRILRVVISISPQRNSVPPSATPHFTLPQTPLATTNLLTLQRPILDVSFNYL